MQVPVQVHSLITAVTRAMMLAGIGRQCGIARARMTGNNLRLAELQSGLGESAHSWISVWQPPPQFSSFLNHVCMSFVTLGSESLSDVLLTQRPDSV